MMKWVVLVFAVAFLAASCIGYQPVNGASNDLVVPDGYATIQEAVDAAQDGDCIYVRNGVYYENVVVNKSISLIGEDWERTAIAGNASEMRMRPLTINHDNVTVKRLALIDSWQGVCIDKASGCSIVSCKILNNHYGVLLNGGSNNIIIGNVFSSIKFGAYGIQLIRTPNNLIQANQLTNLSEGITINDQLLKQHDVIQSYENRIIENQIANISDKAVWFTQTQNNLLSGNTISNSTIGLALMWTDNNSVYSNNFMHNTFQVAGGKEPVFSGGSGIRWSICQWDDGERGNYWSDYNGADGNGDGLGDTPYLINEKNNDIKPLMQPKPYPQLNVPAEETDLPTAPPTANPTTNTPNSDAFPIGQIVAATIAIAVVAAGIAVFLKNKTLTKTLSNIRFVDFIEGINQ